MEGRSIADAIRTLSEVGLGARARTRIFGMRGSAPGYFVARLLSAHDRPSVVRAPRRAAGFFVSRVLSGHARASGVVAPTLAQAEGWLRALRFFLGEEEGMQPLE